MSLFKPVDLDSVRDLDARLVACPTPTTLLHRLCAVHRRIRRWWR